MFGDQPLNFTMTAAGAIPRYAVVQGSGTATVGLATADTQNLLGIAQSEAAAAGEFVSICPLGRSRAVAGAAVSAYARITSNGSGRVVAAASGDVIIGYALEAAGADGDSIQVMLNAAMDKVVS